ncbi:MAG: ABC transporter permease [Bryobacteraceae bacterium]
MNLRETLRFAWQSLTANRTRTLLTALGLLIGNASVILVVTISLTSRELILEQIRGIGSNMIYAYYAAASEMTSRSVDSDYIKMADVEAVRQQLSSRIVAATGVMTNFDRMVIQGKEEDVKVIGSDDHYARVRNLRLLAGRFLDASDVALRHRVVLLTDKLATRLFGSHQGAVGQTMKLYGLQFTVVGVFKERTETGQTELQQETALIPVTVIRYFTPVERVDPLYVQARSLEDVRPVTELVRTILESRHRAGAKYTVENLAAILDTASEVTVILTIVLIMVAAIALIISGIGIMNIMLVTVTERTREIGLRLAIGAPRKAILAQFLLEAVLISLTGGLLGILIGIAIPASVRLFAEGFAVPVSWAAVAVAFAVSFVVGLIFGIIPANRASRMNPTEALRYE